VTKLFVLGASGAGKTPVARQLADALGVPHIGASQWVRRAFPPVDDPTQRQQQIEAMTRFSIEELRANPRACLDFIQREQHDLADAGAPCVVEGMRNPFDFVHAFDPRRDLVVMMERADNTLQRTAFERGLDVIRDYLAWLRGAGLMDDAHVLARTIATAAEIEAFVADALTFCAGRVVPTSFVGPQHVHAQIAPQSWLVQKEILYGNDAKYAGDVVPCKVFAVSSYPGSTLTFKILLDDGAVFSYVAPHQLRTRPTIEAPGLDLRDLVYLNCPDESLVVERFDALASDRGVLCYFKHRDLWMKGSYVFTVDWYTGNDLLHCVTLENGQIALLPHHKIKFHDDAPGFQPYKKIRADWRV